MFIMPRFSQNTPESTIQHRLKMISEREQGSAINKIIVKYNTTKPTFYKFYQRYQEYGKMGLQDLSKAPQRHGTKTNKEDEKNLEDLFIQHPYFSSYELNQLVSLNPRTIQRIIKRKNLQKVYKPKAEKKKILEQLKRKEQLQRKKLKK